MSAAIGMSAEEFLQSATTQADGGAGTVGTMINQALFAATSQGASSEIPWSQTEWRQEYWEKHGSIQREAAEEGITDPQKVWEYKQKELYIRWCKAVINYLRLYVLDSYQFENITVGKWKLKDLETKLEGLSFTELTTALDELLDLGGEGVSVVYFPVREPLMQYVFEYLYTYSSLFKTIVDNAGYGIDYTLNPREGRGEQVTTDTSERPMVSSFPKGWGRSGTTRPLGTATSEMGKVIFHENLEPYIMTTKFPGNPMWLRCEGHFIAEVYLEYLEESGFFQKMAQGQEQDPNQRIQGLTPYQVVEILAKRYITNPWGGTLTSAAENIADYKAKWGWTLQ